MIEAFRRVVADLDEVEAPHALVGGFAVAVRAEPRFTRDVDVALSVSDDAQAERLVRAMRGRGYQTITAIEQTATGRLATVRLRPPRNRDVGTLDLLFASSGIEPEVVGAATQERVLPGLRMPVATAAHLVALKVLSMDDEKRPQDRIDLSNLVPLLDAEELLEARTAVEQILQRGFGRGHALLARLDQVEQLYRSGDRGRRP